MVGMGSGATCTAVWLYGGCVMVCGVTLVYGGLCMVHGGFCMMGCV